MKRKVSKVISLVMSFLMILGVLIYNPVGSQDIMGATAAPEKKAVWISYLDYGSLKNKGQGAFRTEFTNMCNNVVANGLNTVIVQVRAYSDAIYPSAYYPWCTYITTGKNGPGYDPLAAMIEIAHSKGLKFEAWINPYRISTSTSRTNTVKASGWLNGKEGMYIEYTDSAGETCLMLDPANAAARELVVTGIKEVVYNYAVDGIHFDDYFYQSAALNNTTKQERKNNVNLLVSSAYSAIKASKPSVTFGISPMGNISGCENLGADITTWMSNDGYVDYVMPQLYWSDNYGSTGGVKQYTNSINEWLAKWNGNAKLYVGLALYKCGQQVSGDMGWSSGSTNLRDQLVTALSNGITGFALFRYSHLLEAYTETELGNFVNLVADPTLPDTLVYQAHVAQKGWLQPATNGAITGTVGEGIRMEGIKIAIDNRTVSGTIIYQAHVAGVGWQSEVPFWETAGTTGQSRAIEAIKIRLTDELAKKYDIYYRVYVSETGWLGWTCNGSMSGTSGIGKPVEAIQMKLLAKGNKPSGSTANPSIVTENNIAFNVHVQNYGWRGPYANGSVAGTTGESKRVEAFSITNTSGISGGIRYRAHVQGYGWMAYAQNGNYAGTIKESRRVEAIVIEPYGEFANQYDIYYRVHVQEYGWLGWTKNGNVAGTTGLSKRIEAIQIMSLPKGSPAPGSTSNPYIK